jgi:UDP-2,3-diacylglucosamine pyrophosphatase LpxH
LLDAAMPEARIVIISDLHLGAGPLDDCDGELESLIVEFLNELSEDGPVQLVINGDFLDFVQASPWQGTDLTAESKKGIPLCFTEAQSVAKLESITKTHRSVFQALSRFVAANDMNTVVIVPGNHDADFFWPAVREVFSDTLFGEARRRRNRLEIFLDHSYTPPDCPTVQIDHGHQHDPTNCFTVGDKTCWSASSPPIFEDCEGKKRLLECVGTRFLIRFLNKLDFHYPFVDNVKPFSRFLIVFGASALQPGFGPLKAAVSVWGMLRFLADSVNQHPTDLLGIPTRKAVQLKHPALRIIEAMTTSEQEALAARLNEFGFAINRSLGMSLCDSEIADAFMDFLSENLDVLEGVEEEKLLTLSLSSQPGTLTLKRAYSIDENEALKDAAERTMRNNALDATIMGHTHEVVNTSRKPLYLNTGTWIRYYRFRADDKIQPWSILKSGSYELFPYQLNYAEVCAGSPPIVRMKTFRERYQ